MNIHNKIVSILLTHNNGAKKGKRSEVSRLSKPLFFVWLNIKILRPPKSFTCHHASSSSIQRELFVFSSIIITRVVKEAQVYEHRGDDKKFCGNFIVNYFLQPIKRFLVFLPNSRKDLGNFHKTFTSILSFRYFVSLIFLNYSFKSLQLSSFRSTKCLNLKSYKFLMYNNFFSVKTGERA